MIAFALFEGFYKAARVYGCSALLSLVSVSPLLMTIVVDVFATIRLSMSDILS